MDSRCCVEHGEEVTNVASGSLAVPPDGNAITAALQLLKTLPLAGVIITGEVMFTQREICRVITEGEGGDDFFTVKDNQPALKAGHAPQLLAALRNTALTLLRRSGFKPAEGFEPFAEHRPAAINAVSASRTE